MNFHTNTTAMTEMVYRLQATQTEHAPILPSPSPAQSLVSRQIAYSGLPKIDLPTCLFFNIENCAAHNYLDYVQRLRRVLLWTFLPRLGPLGNRRSFFARLAEAKKNGRSSASAFLLPDLGNAWLDPMSLTHVGEDSLHEFGLRQKVHFKKILPLLALGINARIQSIT